MCEDLAEADDVAEMIRSVGPTIVFAALLDGPQLNSRWSARYASVLADNPGSGVLTLTSAGMVQRSRPQGLDTVPIIALWKGSGRGIREIPLEPGTQGVLLTISGDLATRRSADGRWPVEDATGYFDVAVHQVRASSTGSVLDGSAARMPVPRLLDADELTVLTGWAEGVAEALACAPQRATGLLSEARAGAQWRAALGIAPPSQPLRDAIDCLGQLVSACSADGAAPTFDALLLAARHDRPDEPSPERLARQVLEYALEQVSVRQSRRI